MTFCRPEYWIDRHAWDEVIAGNCYRLPDSLYGRTIIDIGGHIGCFALAAAARGAAHVLSIEPHPLNYAKLVENVGGLPTVEVKNFAVWRSDVPDGVRLKLHAYQPGDKNSNTGMSTVAGAYPMPVTHEVPSVGLDRWLDYAAGHVSIKLDCEGAEYPILYTSKKLAQVDEIWMETHDIELLPEVGMDKTVANTELMVSFLVAQGFGVQHEPTPHEGRYTVHAKRK